MLNRKGPSLSLAGRTGYVRDDTRARRLEPVQLRWGVQPALARYGSWSGHRIRKYVIARVCRLLRRYLQCFAILQQFVVRAWKPPFGHPRNQGRYAWGRKVCSAIREIYPNSNGIDYWG